MSLGGGGGRTGGGGVGGGGGEQGQEEEEGRRVFLQQTWDDYFLIYIIGTSMNTCFPGGVSKIQSHLHYDISNIFSQLPLN